MKRRALVVQHHIVGARHTNHEIHAGIGQQHHQVVHVVLVGLGMVGVADVASHRQAHQLAAKMVFQTGPDDLLAVVQILRTDEADHRVDQQRAVAPRHRIGPGLAGLLVQAVVRVGRQRAALAGFKIHQVGAHRAALQRLGHGMGFVQQCQADAERLVGRFGAGNRLKHQIDRRALLHCLHGVGHMGQHAGLGGHLAARQYLVEQVI